MVMVADYHLIWVAAILPIEKIRMANGANSDPQTKEDSNQLVNWKSLKKRGCLITDVCHIEQLARRDGKSKCGCIHCKWPSTPLRLTLPILLRQPLLIWFKILFCRGDRI
jgi:hypothetical protein